MRHHLRIGVLRLWIRLVGCCIAGTFGGLCPLEAQQPGQQIWTFNAGGIVFSSPALGEDGTVYVGAQIDLGEDAFAGKLFAINPDGSLKWEFTADDWMIGLIPPPQSASMERYISVVGIISYIHWTPWMVLCFGGSKRVV